MARFEFVTCWHFRAPLEQVWAEVYAYERWPLWWKGVEQVKVVRAGAPNGVGTRTEQVWKSVLPYRLRFDVEVTGVDPLRRIDVQADGELRGTGAMNFWSFNGEVIVRFDWTVETTRPWMNAVAPVARSLFEWNHGVIMKWGAECLDRRLQGATPLTGGPSTGSLDGVADWRAATNIVAPAPVRTDDNWLMIVKESDLLFASWAVLPGELRPLVPAALELDTFDGEAWVTVEALKMAPVRFRAMPLVAYALAEHHEVAVRTYVRFRGQRAIYFLSLERAGSLRPRLIRRFFHLPSHGAAVTITVNGDHYHAESLRTRKGASPVQFAAVGRIAGAPQPVRPGTLDDFLLKHTCMLAVSPGGDVYRADVAHRTSAIQRFDGLVDVNTLLPACGVPMPATPPLFHYYAGEHAIVWPMVRCDRLEQAVAVSGS